jgi:aspartoacylase
MTIIKKIGAVAIVGGTHGNELTGIYTVKQWRKANWASNFPEFQIEYLLANKAAIEENRRYLDKDLNRCFTLDDLSDLNKNNKEQNIARNINQALGPKGNARVDFIIDLHTSTANMQTNIVLIKVDEFHLKLAAYIKKIIPSAIITTESNLMSDHHFLCSIAEKGVLIEIGPIAQGTLDSDCFDKTNIATKTCLDFVNLYNNAQLPDLGKEIEVISYFSELHFPQDKDGEIVGMIHPSLIGKDYSILETGKPIYKTFSGEDILYDGETANIAFVNEAAYYDQKISMCLCRPMKFSLIDFKPVNSTAD